MGFYVKLSWLLAFQYGTLYYISSFSRVAIIFRKNCVVMAEKTDKTVKRRMKKMSRQFKTLISFVLPLFRVYSHRHDQ